MLGRGFEPLNILAAVESVTAFSPKWFILLLRHLQHPYMVEVEVEGPAHPIGWWLRVVPLLLLALLCLSWACICVVP